MVNDQKMYDLIGIGVGPFNLSLAALLDGVPEVEGIFFEQREKFDWHPGMLIEGTKMQVPFLADLVTMADPTNPYSFLNYITEHNRMYHFYFLQRLEIPRREYNDYCQWAVNKLPSCQFGKRVVDVKHVREKDPYFEVEVLEVASGKKEKYRGKNLVIGSGSHPAMPMSFQGLPNEDVFHTAEFLDHQERCRSAKSITVVGSGQSAAEVFRELLKEQPDFGYRLDWLTRSSGFLSMEDTKLNLEHFSPDYVNYFYSLPEEEKEQIFSSQDLLYKGISAHTITDIYNLLYEYSVGAQPLNVGLQVLTEVHDIVKKAGGEGYELKCEQWQQEKPFTHESDVVIVGTGYRPFVPDFIHHLDDIIKWDENDQYKVRPDYRLYKKEDIPNEIYVHSAISKSHGVGSTNLGLAVHRNKVIINHLAKKEVYPLSNHNVFQNFGIPQSEADESTGNE
ncbi:SidA/IucD/PvdA family monooxygenase [Evansella sp. AB-P1]|uniref:lysine N(6)-hydroxylase/L-ornithine N(5)-oxygenase family protein n=1 Tax=Evansella sp. AB-P1 TaxID=3037653 RepID=UPI00241FBB0A|nr:SidA/IucD/PvdA family monooxygenase [Evansella sp. AB-P1]MDG5789288.1 SidA/IucD/PvdA family monooxygenase [Evansella sp. AB-P1]